MKREFNMNTTKKLVMLLALMLPVTAIALPPYDYDNYEFEVDGIYYKIEGDVACVTFQRYASGMHLSDYHGDVVIPSTVTYQDVTYPVTTIDYYAFNYCQGLTSITIPESITTIKDCAFYLCTSLTCVNLLTPTVVIEKHAFSMCSALTTITCPLTTPPAMYYEECFDSPHYESATLYVPANAVELYRNAPVWEKFVNIQPIDPEMLPGDVNGDGEINIADINAVTDIILTDASEPSGDVNGDGEINIADVNAIIAIILGSNEQPEPEHEYVDLGLPSGTLWATMNIGASAPEEYGDYFAWGETEPKQVFDWSNYKWCNGTADTFTKYCDNAYYGSVDNKMELEPEDDAAYMNWGSEWRMPNLNQIGELCNNCSIQWTMRNDVNGWLFTGPNENTLFLPATGYRWNSSLITGGSRGYFWSISLLSVIPDSALAMVLFSDGVNMNNSNYRSIGMTVRAVRVTQN